MSERKYKTIAVRNDVYEMLKKEAEEKGKKMGDVIAEKFEKEMPEDLEMLKEVFESIFQPFRDVFEKHIEFENDEMEQGVEIS